MGMGGAGFPTRVKIEPNPKQPKENLIINFWKKLRDFRLWFGLLAIPIGFIITTPFSIIDPYTFLSDILWIDEETVDIVLLMD